MNESSQRISISASLSCLPRSHFVLYYDSFVNLLLLCLFCLLMSRMNKTFFISKTLILKLTKMMVQHGTDSFTVLTKPAHV